MRLDPDEYKLMLLELLYESTRVSRFYRGRILHSPVYIEAPGWGTFCQAVEVAAEHARRILAAADKELPTKTLDLELPPIPPLPAISDHLEERMRARRQTRGEVVMETDRVRSQAREQARRARLH